MFQLNSTPRSDFLVQVRKLSPAGEAKLLQLLQSAEEQTAEATEALTDFKGKSGKPLTVEQYKQLLLGFTAVSTEELVNKQLATLSWLSSRFPEVIFVHTEITGSLVSTAIFTEGKNISHDDNPLIDRVMTELFNDSTTNHSQTPGLAFQLL